VGKLAEDHSRAVEEGKMDPNKAALLTKAYSQSKFISFALRDIMIEKTLLLPGVHDELKKTLASDHCDIGRKS